MEARALNMPEEAEEYIIKCYDSFCKQVFDKLLILTNKSVRRQLKINEIGCVVLESLTIGARHFEPQIQFRLVAQCHEIKEDCSCFVCSTQATDVQKMQSEYALQVYCELDPDENGVYFNILESFELTSKIHKIYDKLTDVDFIERMLLFFKNNYPFIRCVNCKATFAKVGNLCYACDALAIKYNMNGDKCSICLDNESKMVCCILSCKHIFHESCYNKYAKNCHQHSKPVLCPLCKVEVKKHLLY